MTTSTMSGPMRKPTYHRAAGNTSRPAAPRRRAWGSAAVPLCAVIERPASGRSLDAGPRLGALGAVVRRVDGVLELGERVGGGIDDRVVLDLGRQQRRGLVVGVREEAELRLRRGLIGLGDVVEEGVGGLAVRGVRGDREAVDPELAAVRRDDVLYVVVVAADLDAVPGPRDRQPGVLGPQRRL